MPDVFLSYSREDQTVARRFAEGFEREGLGVWWDARLRLADPSITLEGMEAFNLSSLFPPDVAADMNVVLRKVWEETPVESPTA